MASKTISTSYERYARLQGEIVGVTDDEIEVCASQLPVLPSYPVAVLGPLDSFGRQVRTLHMQKMAHLQKTGELLEAIEKVAVQESDIGGVNEEYRTLMRDIQLLDVICEYTLSVQFPEKYEHALEVLGRGRYPSYSVGKQFLAYMYSEQLGANEQKKAGAMLMNEQPIKSRLH